jgi:hypothetical protein
MVERDPIGARHSRLTLAVLGAAAATLAICLLSVQSGTSRLSTVPPAERAVLADRTLSNLTEICRGRERPRLFCQDQAELLLELPECGAACRAAARDALGADSGVK